MPFSKHQLQTDKLSYPDHFHNHHLTLNGLMPSYRAAGGGLSKIKKEMATYESFSFASRKCDVLAHEEHLPVLAKIARKILAIPALSVKSERVFSTGGLVVTAQMGRLCPIKLEDLILLKQNLSRVRGFLATTTYKVDVGGHNAFQNIIVHVTEGAEPRMRKL